MAEDSMISSEMRQEKGVEWDSIICEVEKGAIRQFAQAIGDPNPLWQDEKVARQSRYGGIVAPPTFMLTLGLEQIQEQREKRALRSYEGGLHGGTELECFKPVRPGDVITVTAKVADIRERQGKTMDKMVFTTIDVSYKNQNQELVAKCRQLFISFNVKG